MNDGTLIGRLRDHICVGGLDCPPDCTRCRAADEIERLLEALEFYADRNNWHDHGVPILADALEDSGKIARAALPAEGGGDE